MGKGDEGRESCSCMLTIVLYEMLQQQRKIKNEHTNKTHY